MTSSSSIRLPECTNTWLLYIAEQYFITWCMASYRKSLCAISLSVFRQQFNGISFIAFACKVSRAIETHACKNQGWTDVFTFLVPIVRAGRGLHALGDITKQRFSWLQSCPATVDRVEWCHLLCDWINMRYSNLLYCEISVWFQINHILLCAYFPQLQSSWWCLFCCAFSLQSPHG